MRSICFRFAVLALVEAPMLIRRMRDLASGGVLASLQYIASEECIIKLATGSVEIVIEHRFMNAVLEAFQFIGWKLDCLSNEAPTKAPTTITIPPIWVVVSFSPRRRTPRPAANTGSA